MTSALLALPMLWSQASIPSPMSGLRADLRAPVAWLYVFSEPVRTIPGFWGGPITWLKTVSLFCLVAWTVSWLIAALKQRSLRFQANWLDWAALAGLAFIPLVMLLNVLEAAHRIPFYKIGPLYLTTLLGLSAGVLLFLWTEAALWRAIRLQGTAADRLLLIGVHLAIVCGTAVAVLYLRGMTPYFRHMGLGQPRWLDKLLFSVRTTATFMGYAVLARVLSLVGRKVLAIRWRRLFAIAKLTVLEATRRMWAPWVVITIFLVILAFTHWFLQTPRPAEMGRLYVTTLTLLCSLLLTAMVTLMTPLSLPQDIQNQTIYTVVSKPVRRIELVWGRMLGFMSIVTVLVVLFYSISLLYLRRTVGSTIDATVALADKEEAANRPVAAKFYREQADQMRTRMMARNPIYGSLTFLDSRGTPHSHGIDVGNEQSARLPRSHIEGATAAAAIWHYGYHLPDPYNPNIHSDRPVPVDDLIKPDTIEGKLNEVFELKFRIENAERERANPQLSPARSSELTAAIARNREELDKLNTAYQKLKAEADELDAKAKALPADRAAEANALRLQATRLHSPRVPVEMTFNIYRTTKGKLGEAVFAKLDVTNPRTGAQYSDIFPIHEYYTNKQSFPAAVLAGSLGNLTIEVRCITRTQYLGMAETDLYLLSQSGTFGLNFLKGLAGVWLQAMVLTAIGVFAGTFLSWPVALLQTIAFFVAGLLAVDSLMQFTDPAHMLGGGPFESLFRILTHDNQMSDLTPTLAVVTVKTLDSLVMPLLSRLVYIVPNFKAFDVSNIVANGYNVHWLLMVQNLLLAFAYAVPFSIAGYFILKHREVAA